MAFYAYWSMVAAEPALTLYNQNFAVVREIIPLNLQRGVNHVRFSEATSQLEPESVILRDSAGKVQLRILEQSYRGDPVSLDSLLRMNEGNEIEFLVERQGRQEMVKGKIIRAAATPTVPGPYFQSAGVMLAGSQPIIEIDGKLRFQLPGVPVFPGLGTGTVLRPTLDWLIESDTAGAIQAQLAYVSTGFTWEADYNLIARESGDALDVAGWVTMTNQSGRTFENASLGLMAGDVAKLAPRAGMLRVNAGVVGGVAGGLSGNAPQVTERTFDEYHLYTLARNTTLRDRETKQVEFLRASNIPSKPVYVYDGLKIDRQRFQYAPMEAIRQDASYGTQSNTKVWVMREFVNDKASHLGMPLPKGRVRFYRADGGRLEFTGEDVIEHTPAGETPRVFTGAAFDLTGERKRVSFRIDHARSQAEESFEIRVRNRKTQPVEIRVVEHLYRWTSWEVITSSAPMRKTDAQTGEFRTALNPGEEKTITYTVRYSW